MLGQPASWHTVCRPSDFTRLRSSVSSGPIRARVVIQSGFFSINNGWLFSQIDQVIADFKFEGDAPTLQYWIIGINYNDNTQTTYGPFTHSPTQQEFDTINAANRMIAIKIGMSNIGSWWRLGNFRYLASPDGQL